jgi:hypothetical protein
MPFDGTNFRDLDTGDTGLFPNWNTARWRFRLKTRKKRRNASASDRRAAVIAVLEDARALIATEQRWAQGAYWRFPGRHCAIGALRAAAARLDDITLAWAAHALLIEIASNRRFTCVEALNDHSSHAEVIGAFDEAIALARG